MCGKMLIARSGAFTPVPVNFPKTCAELRQCRHRATPRACSLFQGGWQERTKLCIAYNSSEDSIALALNFPDNLINSTSHAFCVRLCALFVKTPSPAKPRDGSFFRYSSKVIGSFFGSAFGAFSSSFFLSFFFASGALPVQCPDALQSFLPKSLPL